MKKLLFSVALFGAISSSAHALTIDTNPTYDGNINNGWDGSGQSLTVDLVENHLDNISFYFAPSSEGRSFSFRISNALTGGTNFFSALVNIVSGINQITTNVNLPAGSIVYALFDYNGFNGQTADFSFVDGYAGGHSFFNNGGGWNTSYTGLDHRFIANFSGNVSTVPIPGALPLLVTALGGVAALGRRRRKAKI